MNVTPTSTFDLHTFWIVHYQAAQQLALRLLRIRVRSYITLNMSIRAVSSRPMNRSSLSEVTNDMALWQTPPQVPLRHTESSESLLDMDRLANRLDKYTTASDESVISALYFPRAVDESSHEESSADSHDEDIGLRKEHSTHNEGLDARCNNCGIHDIENCAPTDDEVEIPIFITGGARDRTISCPQPIHRSIHLPTVLETIVEQKSNFDLRPQTLPSRTRQLSRKAAADGDTIVGTPKRTRSYSLDDLIPPRQHSLRVRPSLLLPRSFVVSPASDQEPLDLRSDGSPTYPSPPPSPPAPPSPPPAPPSPPPSPKRHSLSRFQARVVGPTGRGRFPDRGPLRELLLHLHESDASPGVWREPSDDLPANDFTKTWRDVEQPKGWRTTAWWRGKPSRSTLGGDAVERRRVNGSDPLPESDGPVARGALSIRLLDVDGMDENREKPAGWKSNKYLRWVLCDRNPEGQCARCACHGSF